MLSIRKNLTAGLPPKYDLAVAIIDSHNVAILFNLTNTLGSYLFEHL